MRFTHQETLKIFPVLHVKINILGYIYINVVGPLKGRNDLVIKKKDLIKKRKKGCRHG